MNETVNQEMNGTAPAQQENRTFTQDEVNDIVADRLARERAKYADYDDLKAQAGKTDALQQQLDAIAADKARREMKQKVSDATGVTVELLTGETEEACTAQAQAIRAYTNPYPNVKDGGTAGAIGNFCPYNSGISDAFSRDRKHQPKEPPKYW